jgi:hypothetical protein
LKNYCFCDILVVIGVMFKRGGGMKSKKLFIVVSMLILAGTLIFIACPTVLDYDNSKTGAITGTITITDIPSSASSANSAPKLYISVSGYDDEHCKWWHSWESSQINFLNTSVVSNASWSIPIHEDRGFFPSNGTFILFVNIESADSNGWFNIDIPITPYINSVNDNVGSLGTVSINYITLSGNINVTFDGQTVPNVLIDAYTKDDWIGAFVGYAHIISPSASASWSIPILVLDSLTQVVFRVSGYSDDWKLLFCEDISTPTVNAYNQDISGITINLGNVDKDALKGRQYPPQFIEDNP